MDNKYIAVKIVEGMLNDEVDYIFVIRNEDDDDGSNYKVGVSVHKDPKLGFQVLRDNMSKNDANRLIRQLERKWKNADTLQFEVRGEGYRKKYKKKRVAELGETAISEALIEIANQLIKSEKGK